MNNNLDSGFRVYHNGRLVDVYQHYQKESVTRDIVFKDFKTYMQWLRKQVKSNDFLYE
jgi:hypothetical protein